jgi:replicative DNA helicase
VLEQLTKMPEQSVEVPKNETVVVEDSSALSQGELRMYARRMKRNEKTWLMVTLMLASFLS